MRRIPLPALIHALPVLALALWTASRPGAQEVAVHLEAPLDVLAGSRTPLRFTFREPTGDLTSRTISFRLAVTGSARFAAAAETGTLLFGGGGPFIGAEAPAGLFEIGLDTPAVETISFYFETQEAGVGPLRRSLFTDPVRAGRIRWTSPAPAPGAAPRPWVLAERPGAPPPREGTLAWWSGPLEPGTDSALVSVPLRLPGFGSSRLRFRHLLELHAPGCPEPPSAPHGARVELEAEPGEWVPVAPPGGYPRTVAGTCPGPLDGQGTFTDSLTFGEATVDLTPLAGRRGRLRFRLRADCEVCGAPEGWSVDDIAVETEKVLLQVREAGADPDGDGLEDSGEVARGTDPEATDTDGDGLSDRVEDLTGIFASRESTGTDPLSPDTDGGGAPDGAEVELGTDPNRSEGEPRAEALPALLPSRDGRRWSIRGDGTAGEAAADPLEETFSGAGGFQLHLAGAPFPLLGETYVRESAGGAPRELLLGPATIGSLAASRRLLASPERGFLRILDLVENRSAEPLEVDLELASEFAPKPWVEVEATADGRPWNPGADFAHFNDRDPRDGMPVVLWLYSNPGAALEPRRVALAAGRARITFSLALAPGERRGILHFASMSSSLEASEELARLLAGGGLEAAAGLTLEDERAVANMALDRDGDGMPGAFELRHGFDPSDPADGAEDADGDGLSNAGEYREGTDPGDPDSDGDGIPDGVEVHERGTDPLAVDTDADGLADGEDPFPRDLLSAAFGGRPYALVGQEAPLEIQVLRQGEPFGEEVRFRVDLDGEGAVFGAAAEGGGEVLAGGGTSSVLVAVRGGALILRVEASAPGLKRVTLRDSESQGIVTLTEVREDFESSGGGFEAAGARGAWQRGEAPAAIGAPSGTKVWGTGLGGSYPPGASDTLTTPEFLLGAQGSPRLEIQSFVDIEEWFDTARVEISAGGDSEILGELPAQTGSYRRFAWDLAPHRGRRVRFRFVFTSDESIQARGWFLDDFRLEGLPGEGRLEFLFPGEDADGDGIDNGTEIERGTDPTAEDSDGDGLSDAAESGTGVFQGPGDTGTDPLAPDTDGGGELDGSEVAAGRDPHDPLDDQVLVAFSFPSPGWLPITDGTGREWLATALGSALYESEQVFLEFGELGIDGALFVALEGVLTRAGHLLSLSSEPLFLEVPVARSLFVSPLLPLIRWLDVVENPGAAPVEVEVASLGLLASVTGLPEVLQTASGDATLDPDDEYYIAAIDDPPGRLYVGRVLRTAGPVLRPIVASLVPPFETVSYRLPVPARGRAGILHFALVSPRLEEVESLVQRVLGLEAAALEGLGEADLALAANVFLDTDGDGMPDGWEREGGLDPGDPADRGADPDADGLANAEEYASGTDPRRADTDEDGLTDGEERGAGTDPRAPDTDGDGLADGRDPFPLHELLLLGPERLVAVAGEEILLRLHLEAAGRETPPPPAVDLGPVALALELSPAAEVGEVIRGRRAGQVFLFEGEWLAFRLRPLEAGALRVSWEERAGHGVAPGSLALRVLDPAGDGDEDGLPNRFEVERGTDPLEADTDGDGLGDRFETRSGVMVPALEIGTFPWARDSDGGGGGDGSEAFGSGDPFDPDDDLRPAELPRTVSGAGGEWDVLPSWGVTDRPRPDAGWDNGAVLTVGGVMPEPAAVARASRDGNAIVLGPAPAGALSVSRRIEAHPHRPLLRVLDTVRNEGPAPLQILVSIHSDLAGDTGVEVLRTSSGDGEVSPDDRWVLFRHRDRSLLHVVPGRRRTVRLERPEPDVLRATVFLELSPGETRSVVHFLGGGPRSAAGELEALAAEVLRLRSPSLEGLSPVAAGGLETALGFAPILWGRSPRGPVAPGELWVLEGEFLAGVVVRAGGGGKLEPVAAFLDRLVLRAPGEPGELRVEVARPAGELFFPEGLQVAAAGARFRRGDVDGSGRILLTDAAVLLEHLFRGGREPGCADAADADDSGVLDLADAVSVLEALFSGRVVIPYPGGVVPGPDPSPDALGCDAGVR